MALYRSTMAKYIADRCRIARSSPNNAAAARNDNAEEEIIELQPTMPTQSETNGHSGAPNLTQPKNTTSGTLRLPICAWGGSTDVVRISLEPQRIGTMAQTPTS
jgi:hypothetical protein